MSSQHIEVPSPRVAAYIGFAAQANLVRFENAGASTLNDLTPSFNPGGATGTQRVGVLASPTFGPFSKLSTCHLGSLVFSRSGEVVVPNKVAGVRYYSNDLLKFRELECVDFVHMVVSLLFLPSGQNPWVCPRWNFLSIVLTCT